MKNQFTEEPTVYSEHRVGRPQLREAGDKVWSEKDGVTRKQILDEVGLEYKQINYLATIVAELLKVNPEVLAVPEVAEAVDKFAKINELRGIS